MRAINRMLGRWLLVLAALFAAEAPAGHAPWVTFEVLEDTAGSLSVHDVVASGGWAPSSGTLKGGVTKSIFWVRITLDPLCCDEDVMLGVRGTVPRNLQLFKPNAAGLWAVERNGVEVPREEWAYRTARSTFRINASELPGRVLYLRVKGSYTTDSRIEMHLLDEYLDETNTELRTGGVLVGVYLAMLLLQMSIFVTTRVQTPEGYFKYVMALVFNNMLALGYIHLEGKAWTLVVATIIPAASYWFTILFCTMMDLDSKLPRTSRAIKKFSLWFYGFLYLGSILIDYEKFLAATMLSNVVALFITFSMSVYYALLRDGRALFYLVAFVPIDSGLVVRFMANIGIFEQTYFTKNWLYFGTAIHVCLMSAYFVYKFGRLHRVWTEEKAVLTEQRHFVGMVSHEFRTPLAVIRTCAMQLREKLTAPREESVTRCLNIERSVQKLSELIDGYLEFDKFDTSGRPLQATLVDLYALVEEVVSDSDLPVDRVKFTIDDSVAEIYCDRQLMRTAVRNLLANANRHSPQATTIEVDISAAENDRVVISVRDHGEGVPAAELPFIGQRHFRGKNALGSPGTGLGVNLVQKIVEMHGGNLAIYSTPGRGARFTMNIPKDPRPLGFRRIVRRFTSFWGRSAGA